MSCLSTWLCLQQAQLHMLAAVKCRLSMLRRECSQLLCPGLQHSDM